MLANSPVTRSTGARWIFFASSAVTVAILLWIFEFRLRPPNLPLTPIFSMLFADFDYRSATCMLLLIVAAVFVPIRFSFVPLLKWLGENPLIVAGASAVAMALGTLVVYRNHPLSMDEYAAYFQSQVFASGHLAGHFPPALLDWLIPHNFQNYFFAVSRSSGAVASTYWPAYALLLTPFTLIGVPWLCNPVISGLSLLAVHRIALKIFGDVSAAGLALLLTAASPVIFANGISYYSMPAHLLANAVFTLLLLEPTPRRAFAAGVVGSIALCLHNPVPHILFALPWLLWIVCRKGGTRFILPLAAGYLPLSLLLGLGWFWFCSHLSYGGAPLEDAGASKLASAFGAPTFYLLYARAAALAKIWLWAVPGLVILAGAGAWKWRDNTPCRLLVASAALTLLGYLFVPYDQGHGWGFRYFHSAWFALPLLAAGALARRPLDAGPSRLFEDGGTRTLIVTCALLSLVAGIGLRGYQIQTFMSAQLAQVPEYSGEERHVVIVVATFSFYGADLVQNDPFLRGNVIRMVAHGKDADAAMMHANFPDMHIVAKSIFGRVWSAAPSTLEDPNGPVAPAR